MVKSADPIDCPPNRGSHLGKISNWLRFRMENATPRRRRLTIALGCALLILFAWFVWPTPFRYQTVRYGVIQRVVRINRITGQVCYNDLNGGWTDMLPEHSTISARPDGQLTLRDLAAATPDRCK
jgi:hypothetical protein